MAVAPAATALVKCKAEKGAVCYLMQMGTGPAPPEAWAAPLISALPLGQEVYFRIAIVRRGGVQGAWSGVLEVTAR